MGLSGAVAGCNHLPACEEGLDLRLQALLDESQLPLLVLNLRYLPLEPVQLIPTHYTPVEDEAGHVVAPGRDRHPRLLVELKQLGPGFGDLGL